MARPKKQPEEKRDASIRADVTLAEKAYIKDQADLAGISEAEYLRRRALGFAVSPPPSKVDASLVSELNRIGVNVNQLALAVHTDRDFIRFWAEVGSELKAVLAKVARGYGS